MLNTYFVAKGMENLNKIVRLAFTLDPLSEFISDSSTLDKKLEDRGKQVTRP